GRRQLAFSRRFIFHNVTRYSARRYGIGTRQIHLAGPAAAGEVPVLCTDDNLIGTGRDARTGVDAGAAAWFDHVSAGFPENIEVALPNAIVARFLRAELDVELN